MEDLRCQFNRQARYDSTLSTGPGQDTNSVLTLLVPFAGHPVSARIDPVQNDDPARARPIELESSPRGQLFCWASLMKKPTIRVTKWLADIPARKQLAVRVLASFSGRRVRAIEPNRRVSEVSPRAIRPTL